jgi:hypothetical protein
MDDEAIIERALAMVAAQDPLGASPVFASVKAQLLYLQGLLHGEGNPARLKDIILGVQAAKEFDGYPEIADPLFDAFGLAQRLEQRLQSNTPSRPASLLRRLFGQSQQEHP